MFRFRADLSVNRLFLIRQKGMFMWRLVGGVLIGWGLGSNDSANIYGTGVAADVLKYRTAIILISIFVIVGALLEGHKSMDTVGAMSKMSHDAAFVAAI